MPAVIVKRFVGGYTGNERYSIRRHEDGVFQVYFDNPYEGIPQTVEDDFVALSGLYADVQSAEAELRRLRPINDQTSIEAP